MVKSKLTTIYKKIVKLNRCFQNNVNKLPNGLKGFTDFTDATVLLELPRKAYKIMYKKYRRKKYKHLQTRRF